MMNSRRCGPSRGLRHGTLVVIAVSLVAACGPSQEEFREADPTGYEACSNYARSIGAGGDYRREAEHTAAEAGLRSDTDAIRSAVDDRNGGADGAPLIPDAEAFKDACEDAGYNF